MRNIEDWGAWKITLGKAVKLGEAVGMSDDTINKAAERVGTFLSSNVDPRNKEERLLKELWEVGDDLDRQTLAKLVTRITYK